jgi:hypothetical protein
MQNIGNWSWRLKLIGFWNSWKVYKPIKRFDIDTGSSVSIWRRLTSLYVMDVLQKWFLTAVKHQWNLETGWYRGGRKKTSYSKVLKILFNRILLRHSCAPRHFGSKGYYKLPWERHRAPSRNFLPWHKLYTFQHTHQTWNAWNDLSKAFGTHGGEQKYLEGFGGKDRKEDYIKMDLQEMG